VTRAPRCGFLAIPSDEAVRAELAVGASLAQTPTMFTILLIVLVLLAVGSFPSWPHSRGWGYYPSGGLGLVLVIVLLFFLLGPHRTW
jgi:hypothetical protein